ncbi:MAG: hypothetical protein LCI00_33755 [Chloroflexi bacterium]|nr:hypothetical protein [Chloroflexota bacterium]MCC6894312.1 hypothetical protein [Anaerolineae bacterium]
MGISVVWDNPERTIIRFIYNGQWSLDNFYQALNESHQMMDSVDFRVGIIIDMENSKLVPNGVLSHGKNVSMRKHQNQGKSVIVGAGGLVRTLFDVYRKVYRTSFDDTAYHFVSNLDEARTLLLQQQAV